MRLLGPLAAALLALLPLTAAAQDPTPVTPPAGAVVVLVAVSDGLTLLPVGQAVVPPIACAPGGVP